eukprot:794130-Alexandrium_andersonii.AAC.1
MRLFVARHCSLAAGASGVVAQVRSRGVYRSAPRPGASGADRRRRSGWPPRGCCACSACGPLRRVARGGAAL